MRWKAWIGALSWIASSAGIAADVSIERFRVPEGAHPHDVAPSPEPSGPVWYTAQAQGALGMLDPATGKTRQIPLGSGSSPHGVIVGPDGAPWITDSGLNAIVRVDPKTFALTRYPLPEGRNANLNTAAFDGKGILWFTGQSGIYGRLDPASGSVRVFDAPRGRGPYGITATPAGDIYYASLAGSHIARIDTTTGEARPIDPPTPRQGARRIWSDSTGRVWVSEWQSGQLSRYDPKTREWRAWRLPGSDPHPYAIYVDRQDRVWVSDFGANAVLRFDPATERFESFPSPQPNAAIRQILGRPGETWAAESGTDHVTVYRWQ
ncbi:hydrolase [Azoarcus sp. KH32C]|uniref:Vgb family protein n=1 Tax=Azoarcus sp. KH32C TaxID=748247 RepID=UPI0002386517|nr:hydrolase [Azoarcus sp. KH32C]BAL25214.1 putative hydrolase transmembrane protein [Azoarcus sp. KH32C]